MCSGWLRALSVAVMGMFLLLAIGLLVTQRNAALDMAMGGRIRAKSTVGEGAGFEIDLPSALSEHSCLSIPWVEETEWPRFCKR